MLSFGVVCVPHGETVVPAAMRRMVVSLFSGLYLGFVGIFFEEGLVHGEVESWADGEFLLMFVYLFVEGLV